MNDVTEWVRSAIIALKLDAEQLSERDAALVVEAAMGKFVNGWPRVWWMDLKLPAERTPSKGRSVTDVLPTGHDRCWFIPENDEFELPVFDVRCEDVAAILDECPLIEYYVVSKAFNWLVCESEHDDFYVCDER